ncbi:MAG: hypothetical protein PVSMB7_02420 [Chloroflexota bacterium]
MEETALDDEIFDKDGALTRTYLLSRGYCCGNGCRNCPYIPRHAGLDARPPLDAVHEPTAKPGTVE